MTISYDLVNMLIFYSKGKQPFCISETKNQSNTNRCRPKYAVHILHTQYFPYTQFLLTNLK